MNLGDLRLSYTKGGLTEADALPDPFDQFAFWFVQAQQSGNPEPNAMALGTVSAEGVPGLRMVLLKGVSPRGFVFYTNYESRKGRALSENANASLLFYWPELERQVRITGSAHPTSREESAAYFHSRPAGHQLGAWASSQSARIAGREVLELELAQASARFAGEEEIPLPPFWGGYCLAPVAFEFWQGRPNRLHDRLEYVRDGDSWTRYRLAP